MSFLAVAAFGFLWVGVRGGLAYLHLHSVQTAVAGDASSLLLSTQDNQPSLENLAADAAAAHDLTSDPIWRASENLPWVGPQLNAIGTVTAATDKLIAESLLPMSKAAQGVSLDQLRPVNGRIDSSSIADLSAAAQSAAASATDAADSVSSINQVPLLGKLGSAVESADNLFEKAATALDVLSRTTRLLPGMLGEQGPRTYLVLVQNNAEWRSLGGISGTTLLLQADQGQVSLVSSASATDLSKGIDTPVAELPAELTDIYGTSPARYFHNLTQIPDFAVDGPLAKEMFKRQTGIDVDGVIALDPVALSYLLEATGPLTLPDGEVLEVGDAAATLMNTVYLRYPEPSQQDAFFSAASASIFQAFLEGKASAPAVLKGLARAGDERRLLIWSSDPAEANILRGSTVAGGLPESSDSTVRFGVYLNDGTGSKMSYYVTPDVSVRFSSCGAEGDTTRRTIVLRVSLTNTLSPDLVPSLPWFVTGGGVYGVPPGTARVVTNIYIPPGFEVVSSNSTTGATFRADRLGERSVLTFGADLPPTSSSIATITVSGPTIADRVQALSTPSADASISPTAESSCTDTAVGPALQ